MSDTLSTSNQSSVSSSSVSTGNTAEGDTMNTMTTTPLDDDDTVGANTMQTMATSAGTSKLVAPTGMKMDDWDDDDHDEDEEFETTVSVSSSATSTSGAGGTGSFIESSLSTINVSSDDDIPLQTEPIPAQATVVVKPETAVTPNKPHEDGSGTLNVLMADYAKALDNLRDTMDNCSKAADSTADDAAVLRDKVFQSVEGAELGLQGVFDAGARLVRNDGIDIKMTKARLAFESTNTGPFGAVHRQFALLMLRSIDQHRKGPLTANHFSSMAKPFLPDSAIDHKGRILYRRVDDMWSQMRDVVAENAGMSRLDMMYEMKIHHEDKFAGDILRGVLDELLRSRPLDEATKAELLQVHADVAVSLGPE